MKGQRSYIWRQSRLIQNLKENWLVLLNMTWAVCQIFTKALESLKIGTLMGSFCPTMKMDGLKIYSRVMYHDNEEWMQKLERNWLVNSKLTWVIWRILTWVLKNLKHLQFNRLPLTKVYNIWAKKVWRSYVSWHWILMQNLKKSWLVLWKMTWRIWKIFTRALESLKIRTLMELFYPK